MDGNSDWIFFVILAAVCLFITFYFDLGGSTNIDDCLTIGRASNC